MYPKPILKLLTLWYEYDNHTKISNKAQYF